MGDSLDLPRNDELLESSDLINNECAPLFPLEWLKNMHTHTHVQFSLLHVILTILDQIAAGQVAFIVNCAVIEVAI